MAEMIGGSTWAQPVTRHCKKRALVPLFTCFSLYWLGLVQSQMVVLSEEVKIHLSLFRRKLCHHLRILRGVWCQVCLSVFEKQPMHSYTERMVADVRWRNEEEKRPYFTEQSTICWLLHIYKIKTDYKIYKQKQKNPVNCTKQQVKGVSQRDKNMPQGASFSLAGVTFDRVYRYLHSAPSLLILATCSRAELHSSSAERNCRCIIF